MDDGLRLRKDMSEEELRSFTQDCMHQEEELQNFLKDRGTALNMDAAGLRGELGRRAGEEQSVKPVSDMPEQAVDEKESRRIRREKKQFQRYAAVVKQDRRTAEEAFAERENRLRETEKPDEQAEKMFSKVLCAEHFTPAYVKEHLPEVARTLDAWEKHLKLFQGEEQRACLSEDKKLRLELMEQMYQQGKSAFQTALKALGYEAQEKEAGFEVVSAKYSEEQKQQALEENRILRTRIARGGAEMDDRIADAVLEQVNQLEQEYYENSRKLMREDEEYGFISSGHLSNLEQYDKLLSVKKLLEEKADSAEYAENKELLGKLYEELFRLMEAAGKANEYLYSYEELPDKERYLTADGVRRCAEKRLEEQREKLKVLWERADAVEAGIRRLLKQEIPGRELTEKQSLLLESYMPAEQDVYQKRRLEAKQRAKAYVERERQEREAAAADAMPEEETAIQEICQEYVDRVKQFDTSLLKQCTDEELVERLEELQTLQLAEARMKKLLEQTELTGRQGQKERAVFELKCRAIQAYAEKARAVALLGAYRAGSLDQECFQQEELEGLYEELGQQRTEPLSRNQLLLAAKRLFEKASAAYDSACRKYFTPDAMKEWYNGKVLDNPESTAHPQHAERRSNAYKACAEALGKPAEKVNGDDLEAFFHLARKRIEELTKQLQAEHAEGRENAKLSAELKRYREYCSSIQQERALVAESYSRTGDKTIPVREGFFRPYNVAEWYPAFREMSEDAYETMCARMSAGKLEKDAADRKRMAYYREENMKGLRTFKERMAQHYEMLEEKFHHRVPSMEYIEENFEQLEKWFSHATVDVEIVDNMRDLVDLTKPEDLRLYHLVHYYNALSAYIHQLHTLPILEMSYEETVSQCGKEIRLLGGISADYLDQKPADREPEALRRKLDKLRQRRYPDQRRWRTEVEKLHAPMVAEKFRLIVGEAGGFLDREKPEQLAFVQQVAELAEYIEQYRDVSSLSMQQFRSWLTMAQEQISMLAAELYKESPQLMEQIFHKEGLAKP